MNDARRLARALWIVLALAGCGRDEGSSTAGHTDRATEPVPPGLWEPAPAATPTSGSYVYMESDGARAGDARTRTLREPGNARMTFFVSGGAIQASVSADQRSDGADGCTGTFGGTAAGYYTAGPAAARLEWTCTSFASSGGYGWFAVDAITIVDGKISALDLRFLIRSGPTAPATRAKIHWVAPTASDPVAPVAPPPATLWRAPAGSVPTARSYVYLESDAGDPVGLGQTRLWRQRDPRVDTGPDIYAGASNGRIVVTTLDGQELQIADFAPPDGLGSFPLGYYQGLQRYPYHDASVGGLTWTIDDRRCDTLTGWFVLDDLVVLDGVTERLDLRFEQRCDGVAGALRGQVHYERPSPTPPAQGGARTPPEGLWRAPAGALPASGNYLYFESEPSDWVGQGSTWLFTRSNAVLTAGAGASGVHFAVTGAHDFDGWFNVLSGMARPEPGYYAVTDASSFMPGIDVSGDGRGCNGYTGWFVIDDVTWSGSSAASIDLRFEQQCIPIAYAGGYIPALRGQLHWVAAEGGGSAAPPGPISPPPAGLWDAPAGATPAAGSYVYLAQERAMAGPEVRLYTSSDEVSARFAWGQLAIDAEETLRAESGSFSWMSSLSALAPGYYGGVDQWPGTDPVHGGMAWNGCTGPGSWYVVDRVTTSGGVLTGLDLRFELRCTLERGPLHGKIHWENEPRTPPQGPTAPPPGLWDAPAGATPATGSYVYLQSSLGDTVGGGRTHLYTRQNAVLTVDPYRGDVLRVRTNDDRDSTDAFFAPAAGAPPLTTGYYGQAERLSFGAAWAPQMEVGGYGRGCNRLTGWFVIDGLSRAADGSLATLDLRFEQHCEGVSPALRGKVHWVANEPASPSPYPTAPPPGLWDLATAPAPNSYFYFESDPDDPIGLGRTWLYTAGDALLSASGGASGLELSVDGDEDWTGYMRFPTDALPSLPAYYGVVQRQFGPFPDRIQSEWTGGHLGCSSVSGWVAVDSMTYAGARLTGIDLRFEQRCDGRAGALRGKVHWVAGEPTPPWGPLPVPAGLWDAPAGATPTDGTNWFYEESEPGDVIGHGRTELVTSDAYDIEVLGGSAAMVHVMRAGDTLVYGDGTFRMGVGNPVAEQGYYPVPAPYGRNPTRAQLVWYDHQFGCSATGWFVVDSVSYVAGAIGSLDLRFEQRCLDTGAALHGKLHWVRPP